MMLFMCFFMPADDTSEVFEGLVFYLNVATKSKKILNLVLFYEVDANISDSTLATLFFLLLNFEGKEQ